MAPIKRAGSDLSFFGDTIYASTLSMARTNDSVKPNLVSQFPGAAFAVLNFSYHLRENRDGLRGAVFLSVTQKELTVILRPHRKRDPSLWPNQQTFVRGTGCASKPQPSPFLRSSRGAELEDRPTTI